MNVYPRLQLLTAEQMNRVHHYAIRILEDTGIKVESREALRIFEKSGAVNIDNEVVRIKEELINHAIKMAPPDIEVFKKTGDTAFHLGKKKGRETHFGIGCTNTWFKDIEGSRVELFNRKHMQHSTKLGDQLEHFDMVSTLGIPSDVSAGQSDLFSTLDMYANTDKPLVLLISGNDKIHSVLELLSFLHGELSEKPFIIPYVNPITPLVMNESTTDKMVASIDYNLPIIYSNYGMCGGTSPITEGGSLALLTAELLAGLVFSQLVKEGSKIIMGSLPAAFNMSTMGSNYTTASYLLNLASAEMMDFYEIPHCGTSGSSNGRGGDLIASGHMWLNHLSSCIGKIGCVPFVGGSFESLVFSPASVVLSNQIIGEAKRFARGFTLNDETVNLQEISRVGPGGDYFTSEQTLASLADLDNTAALWPSLRLEAWKELGMPTAEKQLVEATKELYAKAMKASQENMEVIKKGEEFIAASFSS